MSQSKFYNSSLEATYTIGTLTMIISQCSGVHSIFNYTLVELSRVKFGQAIQPTLQYCLFNQCTELLFLNGWS